MTGSIGKTISLRALELFEELSRVGSVQEAARNLGLSAPAASQQLRNLETVLGQELIDHRRRPLDLTPAGHAYLGHVRAALEHLRQGSADLSLFDLRAIRSLRLGIIDDFDGEVTPRLTVALAAVVAAADLVLVTAPSLQILADVAARQADLGIAARPPDLPEGLVETPLLRDPFILAMPRGYRQGQEVSLDDLAGLPFLRYAKGQLLGRQIAAHLARLRLAPEGRIELDSNQALFGLIASGAGWAITTPVGYLRARRYQDDVDLFPLPFTGFARTIALYHRSDWMPEMAGAIADSLRHILRVHVVAPGLARAPWLGATLKVLPDEPAG